MHPQDISAVGSSPENETARTLTLVDGRRLGYAEFGDRNGTPLFYFHGWPSSRLEAMNFHAAGSRLGVRVIGIDRPGMGLSDFKPGFTLRQWPEDVVAVADALSIERFAVVGISSGAPYAFACAHAIPHRLTAAASVSGVGPLDIGDPRQFVYKDELQIIGLARRVPWLARVALKFQLGQIRRNPEKFFADFEKSLAAPDRAVVADPAFKAFFLEALYEAARSGLRGLVASIALEGEPWGFRLEDITHRFHIWQGEQDTLVFPAMARALEARLPDCRVVYYPDEGHVSTVVRRADEIVGTLQAA